MPAFAQPVTGPVDLWVNWTVNGAWPEAGSAVKSATGAGGGGGGGPPETVMVRLLLLVAPPVPVTVSVAVNWPALV